MQNLFKMDYAELLQELSKKLEKIISVNPLKNTSAQLADLIWKAMILCGLLSLQAIDLMNKKINFIDIIVFITGAPKNSDFIQC